MFKRGERVICFKNKTTFFSHYFVIFSYIYAAAVLTTGYVFPCTSYTPLQDWCYGRRATPAIGPPVAARPRHASHSHQPSVSPAKGRAPPSISASGGRAKVPSRARLARSLGWGRIPGKGGVKNTKVEAFSSSFIFVSVALGLQLCGRCFFPWMSIIIAPGISDQPYCCRAPNSPRRSQWFEPCLSSCIF